MSRIKKDDQVIVIAGKDKGKTGRVMHIYKEDDRVLVETINIVKKAQRRTQANPQGGFANIERPLHISNIALVDKKTNKATRIGVKILKDGSKSRIAKRSGEVV